MTDYIRWFEDLGINDVHLVGGKNASLGEMIKNLTQSNNNDDDNVQVPGGFATTAEAYREFLGQNGLDKKIQLQLDNLDVDDVTALATSGAQIREWIMQTPFPAGLEKTLTEHYKKLLTQYGEESSFAVRSSATAEDLPEASFAGQQETYLNVSGIDEILKAVHSVFASLYNDRAIAYRIHNDFPHEQVALSAGIQKMIRSDLASSGVMFTLDTESGFEDVIFITSSYGLGELIVQGEINPDEFYVHKPTLEKEYFPIIRRSIGSKRQKMIFTTSDASNTSDKFNTMTQTLDVPDALQNAFSLGDEDIITLAHLGIRIEKHYGRPMDIEWAKDGIDGQLYIVQARPETVKSRSSNNILQQYKLDETESNESRKILLTGRSIGQRIGKGRARVIENLSQMDQFLDGDVLVTDMTDPNWEPIMKKAAAIVTNRGGRTCHAAIIARELGVPAVVGCETATEGIENGQNITVSCAEGDTGNIYDGLLDFSLNEISLDKMPDIPFDIMMNVGTPSRAFEFSFLPNKGIGLARLEFIISREIGIHPKALLQYNMLDTNLKQEIDQRIIGYPDPVSFYIEKLTEGIATIAAAFWPKPVIVRLSDFKSNEYRSLTGGALYEPVEENPMLGFRGASRYISRSFEDCFELECFALKNVRDKMGFSNVAIMVPFVRTPEEALTVINLLNENDLRRGINDLKIIMMCEIPSNALQADKFLKYFDGFSIGSNDLTQLTLGIDRDSQMVAEYFDERNDAVKSLLKMAISSCKMQNKYIGICGQAPSDYPDFAFWLMEQGINSVSLNPDSVVETWLYLAEHLDNH